MRDSKLKKQDKIRKNDDLKKNGRTSRQVKLKKMKEDIKNYKLNHPDARFPKRDPEIDGKFGFDMESFIMHGMIRDENRKLREEAERLELEKEKELK